MSQRKLNRRQKLRAEQNQKATEKRALKNYELTTGSNKESALGKEQIGLVICRYAKEFEVQTLQNASKPELYRCVARTNLGSIVTGDKVVFRCETNERGVIESRMSRSSLLERPDNFGKLKAVAANIDQMLIVIACEPAPQRNLIDRYLVAAQLMDIEPILVLNKVDLLTKESKVQIDELLETYQALDYSTIRIICSRHLDAKLDQLPSVIQNKTSIIVGQSGVGKSSLINTLLPDANLEIGELSQLTREGTHTTTQAKLFHLPGGGHLIDSPGIRDFSLWHINQSDLQRGFKEIADHSVDCKFRDCQHENEPNCAVLSALSDGQIQNTRFDSFKRIKEAIQDQQARGLTRG